MRDGRAIAAALGGKRFKTSWKFRCPLHKDNRPSAVIRDDGLITCFAGCSREALKSKLDEMGFLDDGVQKRATPEEIAKYRNDAKEDALKLWDDWSANKNTDVVAGYLKSRGITIPVPNIVRRFRVNGWIAPIQDLSGEMIGVQFRVPGQTCQTLGNVTGGALHLAKCEGSDLGIAEGFETALSAMQMVEMPVWCSCGAKNMHEMEIPKNVQRIHIFVENDKTGVEFSQKATDAFLEQGFTVRHWLLKKEFKDCNDYHDYQKGNGTAVHNYKKKGLHPAFIATKDFKPKKQSNPTSKSDKRTDTKGTQINGVVYRVRHVAKEDFFAYMPQANYIYAPNGDFWPASSVDARVKPIALTDSQGNALREDKKEGEKQGKTKKIKASRWISEHRAVETMTWAPGEPQVLTDKLVNQGGLFKHEGSICYNLYHPPRCEEGDASKATRWIEHCHKLFGDDAEHMIKWFAQRVQAPHIKINHALVLIGNTAVGKDTLLDPVKYAVGADNFGEISPKAVQGDYTGFLRSIVLRISEAHDLGDFNRYAFYEHMKAFTASPPDMLTCNEKYVKQHYILNVVGIVFTSNHKTTGIYLHHDDRRHFVLYTPLQGEEFNKDYFRGPKGIWQWFDDGGRQHVAQYLRTLDISDWDAKATPPKTQAFWDIVNANAAPEDAELADVIDDLGRPTAITHDMVVGRAQGEFKKWLEDRRNRRNLPHRFEQCGYTPIRNPENQQGLWRIRNVRQAVYADKNLSMRDQIEAARNLDRGSSSDVI